MLVRWAVERGCTVCPKATSHDHIKVMLLASLPAAVRCATLADNTFSTRLALLCSRRCLEWLHVQLL